MELRRIAADMTNIHPAAGSMAANAVNVEATGLR